MSESILAMKVDDFAKPFDPDKFIGKDWRTFWGEGYTTWRGPFYENIPCGFNDHGIYGEEDIDQRSLDIDITKLGLDDFIFETCLESGEECISGEARLYILKKKTDFVRFGGDVFLDLCRDYRIYKEKSILECIYHNYGVDYMHFAGHTIRHPLGLRHNLVLYRFFKEEWEWDYMCLFKTRPNFNAKTPAVGCSQSILDRIKA